MPTTSEQRAELRAELKRLDNEPYNVCVRRNSLANFAHLIPGLLADADMLTAAAAREAKLRELVAMWRAVPWDGYRTVGLRDAADELEAALNDGA